MNYISPMEKEIWKDIPGYEGLYQASDLGRIKSLNFKRTGKSGILNLPNDIKKNRYLTVTLWQNGVKKTWNVHILIAITFMGHVPNGLNKVVRHKNDIKTENRLSNLKFGTQRDNLHDHFGKINRNLPLGVILSENKKNPYRSAISINGKRVNLGSFLSPEEASEAYQQALNKTKQNNEH